MNTSHDPKEGPDSAKVQPSRREFVRNLGGALFAVTIVDALSETALAQSAPCGHGVKDQTCNATDKDSNCGFNTGTPPVMDADESCAAKSNDESCGLIVGDADESCSAGGGVGSPTFNQDGNCNKTNGHGGTDEDNSCTAGAIDASCSVNGSMDEGCGAADPDANCKNVAGTYDEDQSCSTNKQQADNSCGNASGTVDIDAHCGQPVNGVNDPDGSCNMRNPVIKHTDQTLA